MQIEEIPYNPDAEAYRQGYNAKTLALSILGQVKAGDQEEAKKILKRTREKALESDRSFHKITLTALMAVGALNSPHEGDLIIDDDLIEDAEQKITDSRDGDMRNYESVQGEPLDQALEDFIAKLRK